jgi:hypothetical protein
VSDAKVFRSDFSLRGDPSARANKEVARVDLPKQGVTPSEQNGRILLMVRELPSADRLNRSNVRGVVFDAKATGVTTEDPDASLLVVMQSPANYWMVIGRVPLRALSEFKTHELVIDDAKLIEAMPSVMNIWIMATSSKPLTGTFYFDRIGLMVR